MELRDSLHVCLLEVSDHAYTPLLPNCLLWKSAWRDTEIALRRSSDVSLVVPRCLKLSGSMPHL